MNVGDIMTSKVVTVRPDTSVSFLARLLLDKKISAVPMVDDRGHLAGIVSRADLLDALAGHREEPGLYSLGDLG